MNRRILYTCLMLLVVASFAVPAAGEVGERGAVCTTGTIAAGTPWATDYFVQDTGRPGPTVLIVGGIHGNEVAGARAADQIRRWPIARGKLVVVPRANVPALKANKRLTPSEPKKTSNLNRNFPRSADGAASGTLAAAIWDFVRETRPDWLIDLHEGYDFGKLSKSVGNSIICCRIGAARQKAKRLLDVVNSSVSAQEKKFNLRGPPVSGSLARAAADVLGIRSMILETTRKDQPLSLRTRQHRLMVHRFLADLGMSSADADVLVAAGDFPNGIRVAIYDAGGSLKSPGPAAIERLLQARPSILVERVGPPEIQAGALAQFDVLIVAGGSASKQAAALGEGGCEAIRRFVEDGGGYVGHCAGAYLATHRYTWSLKILDAYTVDRKHWKRGSGLVTIELTPQGRRLLGNRPGRIDIKYMNGPLLGRADVADLRDYTTLAVFRSEIAKNGAPSGVMIGTPAMVAGRYGEGRVFCTSPHPEYTDGLEGFIRRAVLWAAAAEPPSVDMTD